MANRVCASPSSQYTEKHLLNYELVSLGTLKPHFLAFLGYQIVCQRKVISN
jgi:hypothetical protein